MLITKQRPKKRFHVALAIVSGLQLPNVVRAESAISRGVIVESIDAYPGCGPLGQSIPNGDNFMSAITAYGEFNYAHRWVDGQVLLGDFVESSDSASDSFDAPNLAISYFTGHGRDSAGITATGCFNAGNCNTPPPGSTLPGVCLRWPLDAAGRCHYRAMDRRFQLNNCQDVNYSTGVRWGESNFSGGWGGAGTNGGTNMVVIDSSHAEKTGQYPEVMGAIRGTHVLMATMTHTGDTLNTSERGLYLGWMYMLNSQGIASVAWNDTLNNLSDRNTWCQSQFGNGSVGGGYGFNGCGANATNAVGASSAEAINHLNETWPSIRQNSNDTKGNGFWQVRWNCNYDCATWSFTI